MSQDQQQRVHDLSRIEDVLRVPDVLPLDDLVVDSPPRPTGRRWTGRRRPVPTSVPVGPAHPARRGHRLPVWTLGAGTWPLVFLVDVLALAAACLLFRNPWPVSAVLILLTPALFGATGLYRSRLTMAVLDDLPRLLGTVTAGTTAAVVLALVADIEPVRMILVSGVVCLVLVLLGRSIAYLVIRVLRRRGIAHPTVIVGAGRVGQSISDVLVEHAEYGLSPIGFVDDRPLPGDRTTPVPVLGGHMEIPAVLRRTGARTVVIAFTSAREEAMIDVIRECDRLDCEIFVVPRLFEVHHVSNDMDSVWGIPLIRLRRGAHRAKSWKFKRLFDFAASGLALIALSPLMAAIALAVRMEGGPGVLFRQVRVGFDGRQFEVLKFRSLRPVNDVESATNWNISHDDRLGPVGRVIRKSSLDELPQLLNILRGDMSIVGPRPERPHFVAQFREVHPRYWARHRVPCGLTGWAQIHGLRGDTSISDRAKFDNFYVENWSLWLDMKIIVRTAGSVFTRAGS